MTARYSNVPKKWLKICQIERPQVGNEEEREKMLKSDLNFKCCFFVAACMILLRNENDIIRFTT